MFSNFHEAEIPLTNKNSTNFFWIIVRQDSILDKADFLDFLTKFNPLINEYICINTYENGNKNSKAGDLYYWLNTNGLKPFEDYYISNNLSYKCEEKDFPNNPYWIKIWNNKDKGLFADFLNTTSYFYSSEFKKHNKK